MANYNSTQDDSAKRMVTNPDHILPLPDTAGVLYIQHVDYALSSGTEEQANDTIELIDLPLGAIVVPALCSVYSADPGTTLTLDVGYAANPDAYADGITLSAGGLINFTSGTAPSGLATPEKMTSTKLIATVASASTLTDAVVLTFTIAYRLPNAK